MRIVHLSIGLVFIIMLLISGCISGGFTESPEVSGTQNAVLQQDTEPVQEDVVAEEEVPQAVQQIPDISVGDIVVEKDLYHSAEIMRFEAAIISDGYLEGATVRATGISGKMNIQRSANITQGENIMDFEYTLPRCNVCGGIKPGTHTINVQVYSGEMIAENSTSVKIQQ